MGEGRHASFSVISGGCRARGVAFGCENTLAADAGAPLDASFRLERNVWRGAVEPRLVLRHRRPAGAGTIEVVGEPGDYLAAAIEEAERAPDAGGEVSTVIEGGAAGERAILDRRGESPLAVLADATAAGGAVLAVCADVPRRLPGLAARTGGFALASYAALETDPSRRCGRRRSWRWIHRRERRGMRFSVQEPASPIWPGARLSYALPSR